MIDHALTGMTAPEVLDLSINLAIIAAGLIFGVERLIKWIRKQKEK